MVRSLCRDFYSVSMSFNAVRENESIAKFPDLQYIGYGAKNLTLLQTKDKGANQSAHLLRLVSAFVIGSLESMITKLASCKLKIIASLCS